MQGNTMLVRAMEAGSARSRQGLLPGPSWWGREAPQDGKGGGGRTPQKGQCFSPHRRWNHKRNNQHPTTNILSGHIWPETFWNCSTCEHSENGTDHHRTKNRERQTTDRCLAMGQGSKEDRRWHHKKINKKPLTTPQNPTRARGEGWRDGRSGNGS